MKKKIFIFLAALLATTGVKAVQTWDFENGLEDWTVIDANNDGVTWTLTSAIPTTWTYYSSLNLDWFRSGSDAVCSGSYINGIGALSPDEYLVSPLFYATSGSYISFWVTAVDASYPAEHFGVFVSTESNDNPDDFEMVQEWTLTASRQYAGARSNVPRRAMGNWYLYTADLSDYQGQQIYVAIRHFDCSDQYVMAVDDIEIEGLSGDPHDIVAGTSEHGTLTFLVDGEEVEGETVQAAPGQEVTVVVNVEGNYLSSSVIVRPYSNWEVAAARGETREIDFVGAFKADKAPFRNQWTFIMPNYNVEVSAEFYDVNDVIGQLREETELAKMLYQNYGSILDVDDKRDMFSVINQAYALLRSFDKGNDIDINDAQDLLEQLIYYNSLFDEITTGIANVNRETITNNGYYDLNGRRIEGQPAQKGIYILNGKKVVVK